MSQKIFVVSSVCSFYFTKFTWSSITTKILLNPSVTFYRILRTIGYSIARSPLAKYSKIISIFFGVGTFLSFYRRLYSKLDIFSLWNRYFLGNISFTQKKFRDSNAVFRRNISFWIISFCIKSYFMKSSCH